MAAKKVLAIGGIPGTGKSTLMKEFIKGYNWEIVEPVKLIPALYNKELDLFVLGKYEEGEVFCGTDKMSMSCQPNAESFISSTMSNVLFEGDRLFNGKFLTHCNNTAGELSIMILRTNPDILKERYKERGSDQDEKFISGRQTKVNNISSNLFMMDYVQEFVNSDKNDQALILKTMKEFF